MSGIQFIGRNGRREYAVIPMETFAQLVQTPADSVGVTGGTVAGEEVCIPDDVAAAVFEGVHPVKAWRRYRKLTRRTLARETGIEKPFLGQIESGERAGTIAVLTVLAHALKVPVDYLIVG